MLLKRIHGFTHLLQADGNEVAFDELCRVLRDSLDGNTNVYLVSKKGKLLAYALEEGFENTPFDEAWLSTGVIVDDLNASLLKLGAVGYIDGPHGEQVLVAPVVGASRRVGSLMFVK